jgi:hypothetical protein
MNELFGGTKNKNLLFFAAAISVILITAVFLFVALKYIEEKKETSVVPSIPRERTMEEIIRDGTTPVPGEEPIPVSKEIIKSLTTPVNPTADPKNTKAVQSTPIPVSKDYVKNLSQSNK